MLCHVGCGALVVLGFVKVCSMLDCLWALAWRHGLPAGVGSTNMRRSLRAMVAVSVEWMLCWLTHHKSCDRYAWRSCEVTVQGVILVSFCLEMERLPAQVECESVEPYKVLHGCTAWAGVILVSAAACCRICRHLYFDAGRAPHNPWGQQLATNGTWVSAGD